MPKNPNPREPDWVPDQSQYKNAPGDARDRGLIYPNYNIFRTPTGHNLTFDDSAGAESVTLQHATGASIQFLPDGTSVYRSESDNFEVILGDKTIAVKGTVTLVVNGNLDTKVEGDYNLTVKGNFRTAIGGNQETVVGCDDVKEVGGNKETIIGESKSLFVKGPIEQITDDRLFVGAKNNMKFQSTEQNIYIQSQKDIRAWANANVAIESTANTDIKSGKYYTLSAAEDFSVNAGSKIVMSSTQKATLKSTNFVGIDGLKLFFNSNISDPAATANAA